MIERELLDWGVQLTVKPFPDTNATLEIRAEIAYPKPSRSADARIRFSGVSAADPLKLIEAQTWVEAMTALIQEARSVTSEMKNTAKMQNTAKLKKKKS